MALPRLHQDEREGGRTENRRVRPWREASQYSHYLYG
jgi:hypothetical protein